MIGRKCTAAIDSWIPAGKWNRFKPADGVLARLEHIAAAQRLNTSVTARLLNSHSGGVALLLRGHVDRGHESAVVTPAVLQLLQDRCSQSVMRELVAPRERREPMLERQVADGQVTNMS